MKTFIRNNSLTIVFLFMFIICMVFQTLTGFHAYNLELTDQNHSSVRFAQYLSSGHFISATFENWESEFLQMGLFVILTIFLFQKGSSESKDPDAKQNSDVDREPDRGKKDAPWPVKRGGIWLALYKRSLTIALFFLFFISFALHFYGSLKNENAEMTRLGKPLMSAATYFAGPEFWFECMQNWQSEFLSVFAIVLLSVFLRQKGSAQSKPVDMPYFETKE